MVKPEDLPIINKALAAGADVRIQTTRDGYRIIADTPKVLKRVVEPKDRK